MGVTKILDQQVDVRKGGEDCTFNGFLEDYLSLEPELDETILSAFQTILQEDPDVKICVGFRSSINRDAISNQIIRYKDVFKLEGKPLCFPYMLYEDRDGTERALLVVPYSNSSYAEAKGYYYCMTEPGSPFIDCKNDIVAMSSGTADGIVNVWKKLFKMKAGALQRTLDHAAFKDYAELKDSILTASNQLKIDAVEELSKTDERGSLIATYVVKWFLFKKVLYVQYMVNKVMLNTVHEGNVRKQRNQAKMNADEITFLSFSEMWKVASVSK